MNVSQDYNSEKYNFKSSPKKYPIQGTISTQNKSTGGNQGDSTQQNKPNDGDAPNNSRTSPDNIAKWGGYSDVDPPGYTSMRGPTYNSDQIKERSFIGIISISPGGGAGGGGGGDPNNRGGTGGGGASGCAVIGYLLVKNGTKITSVDINQIAGGGVGGIGGAKKNSGKHGFAGFSGGSNLINITLESQTDINITLTGGKYGEGGNSSDGGGGGKGGSKPGDCSITINNDLQSIWNSNNIFSTQNDDYSIYIQKFLGSNGSDGGSSSEKHGEGGRIDSSFYNLLPQFDQIFINLDGDKISNFINKTMLVSKWDNGYTTVKNILLGTGGLASHATQDTDAKNAFSGAGGFLAMYLGDNLIEQFTPSNKNVAISNQLYQYDTTNYVDNIIAPYEYYISDQNENAYEGNELNLTAGVGAVPINDYPNRGPSTQQNAPNGGDAPGNARTSTEKIGYTGGANDSVDPPGYTFSKDSFDKDKIKNRKFISFQLISPGGGAGGSGSGHVQGSEHSSTIRGCTGQGGASGCACIGTISVEGGSDVKINSCSTKTSGGGVGGIGGKALDSGKQGFAGFSAGTTELALNINDEQIVIQLTGGTGGSSGSSGDVMKDNGGGGQKSSDPDSVPGSLILKKDDTTLAQYTTTRNIIESFDFSLMNIRFYQGNPGSNGKSNSKSGGEGGGIDSDFYSALSNYDDFIKIDGDTLDKFINETMVYTFDNTTTKQKTSLGSGGLAYIATQGSDAKNSFSGRAGFMSVKMYDQMPLDFPQPF